MRPRNLERVSRAGDEQKLFGVFKVKPPVHIRWPALNFDRGARNFTVDNLQHLPPPVRCLRKWANL
jgi:hypothetical protein